MGKPTLEKAKETFTWRMSSAVVMRTILRTVQLVNRVFITATTLKMLESNVIVRSLNYIHLLLKHNQSM